MAYAMPFLKLAYIETLSKDQFFRSLAWQRTRLLKSLSSQKSSYLEYTISVNTCETHKLSFQYFLVCTCL